MFRLFELVVRHLDLECLLEFFEQIRLLTETPLPKRTSDISPTAPQNLFPMHVAIERMGDMTLGIIASLRPRYHVCKVWSSVSQLFIQVISHQLNFEKENKNRFVLGSNSSRYSTSQTNDLTYASRYPFVAFCST